MRPFDLGASQPYGLVAGREAGRFALFEAGLTEAAERKRHLLSHSEEAVLSGWADGLQMKEIASSLGKSEDMIRNQLESARERLGDARTSQAVMLWQKTWRR